MTRCKRCVIPDTRPDTAFVDGVCSACIAYANRPAIDWQARMAQLRALLARARETARARGNAYDCIVPSSGGKDSTYQVITLIELGMRPLVVTASTCHLTPIGRKNIDNLARYATTIEVSPNKRVRAKLNRLGLEMVGDISWPEHVAIFTTPFRVARQTGIPFLFYGENPQNQYGGPLESQDTQQMTRRWVSEYGGFLGLRPQDMVPMTSEDAMADYMLPDIEAFGIEAHFLGQYIPWDSHHNAEVARKKGMSWELPALSALWAFENLDNAQTGLHDHLCFRKYGFGRLAAQASVEIRKGMMTRDVALELVARRDGAFPYRYAGVEYWDVLKRLGMSDGELWRNLERFTNWDLFEKRSEQTIVLKELA